MGVLLCFDLDRVTWLAWGLQIAMRRISTKIEIHSTLEEATEFSELSFE